MRHPSKGHKKQPKGPGHAALVERKKAARRIARKVKRAAADATGAKVCK